jgi:NitT/TauT family transport system permease protein
MKNNMLHLRTILPPLFLPFILLVIWDVAVRTHHTPYLIPTIGEVLKEFIGNPVLYLSSSLTTLIEAGLGFLIGNVIAFGLAIWISTSRTAERAIYPFAVALKATPVVALSPLIVVLFGLEFKSKVVIAGVLCFFPLLVQLPDAFRRVPSELIELFKALGASNEQIFTYLRVRIALPEMFGALKTSSSLSVVGAIIGEFISPSGGVGKLILQAQANSYKGQLGAGIIAASLLGMLFFGTIHIVQKLVVYWDPEIL